MKRLLVGLLALGSMSAFTCELINKADLSDEQLSSLYKNNISIVNHAGDSEFLTLEASSNLRAYKDSWGYNLCGDSFCGPINAQAEVKIVKKNLSGKVYTESTEKFSKSRVKLIPVSFSNAQKTLGKLERKTLDNAVNEVIEACKDL